MNVVLKLIEKDPVPSTKQAKDEILTQYENNEDNDNVVAESPDVLSAIQATPSTSSTSSSTPEATEPMAKKRKSYSLSHTENKSKKARKTEELQEYCDDCLVSGKLLYLYYYIKYTDLKRKLILVSLRGFGKQVLIVSKVFI
jgi:hypothetical protein